MFRLIEKFHNERESTGAHQERQLITIHTHLGNPKAIGRTAEDPSYNGIDINPLRYDWTSPNVGK